MGAAIRGVVGQIKWAYYLAAAINNYTVTRDVQGQWRLRATVVQCDRFKLSQRPLVFVAPHARGEWRWPITGYELQAGALTASLGAPEEVSPYGIVLPVRPA